MSNLTDALASACPRCGAPEGLEHYHADCDRYLAAGISIRVTRDPSGRVEVWQGDRTTEALCAGEMLEQVIALIYPDGIAKHAQFAKGRIGIYAMRTRAEWASDGVDRSPPPKPKLSRWQMARVWVHVLGGPIGVGSLLAFVALLIAIAAGPSP
jgi:hypothetical protein